MLLAMNRLPLSTRVQMLGMLVEGNSLRATSRQESIRFYLDRDFFLLASLGFAFGCGFTFSRSATASLNLRGARLSLLLFVDMRRIPLSNCDCLPFSTFINPHLRYSAFSANYSSERLFPSM